jgi:hypothetical protein
MESMVELMVVYVATMYVVVVGQVWWFGVMDLLSLLATVPGMPRTPRWDQKWALQSKRKAGRTGLAAAETWIFQFHRDLETTKPRTNQPLGTDHTFVQT